MVKQREIQCLAWHGAAIVIHDTVNVPRQSETPLGALSTSGAKATVRTFTVLTADLAEANKS